MSSYERLVPSLEVIKERIAQETHQKRVRDDEMKIAKVMEQVKSRMERSKDNLFVPDINLPSYSHSFMEILRNKGFNVNPVTQNYPTSFDSSHDGIIISWD